MEPEKHSSLLFCLLQVSNRVTLLLITNHIKVGFIAAKMKWITARALALVVPVQAGLRFHCSTLTVQRLDPVVQPGSNPSAHVHHIVGGNAFNATMEGDVAARATCTTCEMSEDFSNYWTAALYVSSPLPWPSWGCGGIP